MFLYCLTEGLGSDSGSVPEKQSQQFRFRFRFLKNSSDGSGFRFSETGQIQIEEHGSNTEFSEFF